MELFQKSYENFAAMGCTPNQQKITKRQLSSGQIIHIIKCSLDTITLLAYLFTQAEDIEEYMDSIFSLTVTIGTTICYVSIISKNDQLFNNLESTTKELTFRSNINRRSQASHERINRLVEKATDIIYFVCLKLGVSGFILPKAILSYLTYFTTDAGSSAFQLPFLACFPFDWKNPIGYLIAIVWQCAGIYILLRFLACMAPVACGCFLFAYSLTKDWKNDLRVLKKMAKAKQSEREIFIQLTEFIRSHSITKYTITDFVDVCEVCIFADIMGGTITIGIVMMIIQLGILSQDTIDTLVLLKFVYFGFCIFFMVFISCEMCQRLTNLFEEITNRFDLLNWYLFPMKVQRLLPTVMVNVQNPISIECFGIIEGSRIQFQKVVTVVYKSVNVLREFYK